MKKQTKENIITYFIILITTIVLCNHFLQMHYSSDTYVLMDIGYKNYPKEYFLLDARLISAGVCYLAGILSIPYEAYIIGMDAIGIALMSLAIFIFYKTVAQLFAVQDITKKVMIALASYVLILNQFALEYLLFPESAVMCLGVLLNVISATMVVKKYKFKYLKIFALILLAIFCYQAQINMFPMLAMLLIFAKQIVEKKPLKESILELVKVMLKIAIILIIVMGINLVVLKFFQRILNRSTYRIMELKDWECVIIRWHTVKIYLDNLWNHNMYTMPSYINYFIILMTITILMMSRAKLQTIIKYIFWVLASVIVCTLPMFIFNSGISGRVNMPIAELMGASLIILFAQSYNCLSQKMKKVIYATISVAFIFNAIMLLQNTAEHIAANKIDHTMGKQIKNMVDKYENENNIKVTKISYCIDRNVTPYGEGIKPMLSLTERKFACNWSILQAMNYYCERKFEKTIMDREVYNEYFYGRDDTAFSEEQIIFMGDTMYMLVY